MVLNVSFSGLTPDVAATQGLVAVASAVSNALAVAAGLPQVALNIARVTDGRTGVVLVGTRRRRQLQAGTLLFTFNVGVRGAAAAAALQGATSNAATAALLGASIINNLAQPNASPMNMFVTTAAGASAAVSPMQGPAVAAPAPAITQPLLTGSTIAGITVATVVVAALAVFVVVYGYRAWFQRDAWYIHPGPHAAAAPPPRKVAPPPRVFVAPLVG